MKKTTPLDEIKAALNEMTANQFYDYASIAFERLKQKEVNMCADAFYDGFNECKSRIDTLLSNGVKSTEKYVFKQFNQLPTLD